MENAKSHGEKENESHFKTAWRKERGGGLLFVKVGVVGGEPPTHRPL